MTNLQSVEQDGIVAGNIFAMLDDANRGVNRMKFISLATVHISCHSSKQNLETHGISSRTGSFIFVMGKERADFAAVSAVAEWMSTMVWPQCEFRMQV